MTEAAASSDLAVNDKNTQPTQAQSDAVHKLVGSLQKRYGLTNDDVYTHWEISYKMPSEGSGLGYDKSKEDGQ